MDKFWNDLTKHLSTYYDAMIALLPKLVIAIIALAVFYFIAVNLRKIAKYRLRKRTDDPLLADFIARLAGYIPIIIGILVAFKAVGLGGAATSLLAGAGVSAFALRDAARAGRRAASDASHWPSATSSAGSRATSAPVSASACAEAAPAKR